MKNKKLIFKRDDLFTFEDRNGNPLVIVHFDMDPEGALVNISVLDTEERDRGHFAFRDWGIDYGEQRHIPTRKRSLDKVITFSKGDVFNFVDWMGNNPLRIEFPLDPGMSLAEIYLSAPDSTPLSHIGIAYFGPDYISEQESERTLELVRQPKRTKREQAELDRLIDKGERCGVWSEDRLDRFRSKGGASK